MQTTNDAINAIISQAANQPEPLRRESEKDRKLFEAFFDVMGNVWRIADEYSLGNKLTTTNFVMFGPQSAGKTTLVERILKFPCARVKSSIATTRPTVLHTRHSDKESVQVREEGGSFQSMDKKKVMTWVSGQMQGERVSSRKIFIEVSGPDYMNRRFVDLPGFQNNDDKTGTRKVILNLLQEELKNPNTVVVCVEEAEKEFVSSILVVAMNEVFGEDLRSCPHDFVVALNKSDKWLESGETTGDLFPVHIAKYVKHFGLVPVLAGASIDPSNTKLRESRTRGVADFDDIVREYGTANEREKAVYDSFFKKVDHNLAQCLRGKFTGFEDLLATVDSMVVRRDFFNVQKIADELAKITDENRQRLDMLKKEQKLLDNIELNVSIFVQKLLQEINYVMSADSGSDVLGVVGSRSVIAKHGMTALEEEEKFTAYYDSARQYELFDLHVGGNDKFDRPDEDAIQAWKDVVEKIKSNLRNPTPSRSAAIAYLNQKLVGGNLYERSLAVWASMAYDLLLPNEGDIPVLANLVGTDAEMAAPDKHGFKKTKRLAEVYIGRLSPGVQYLCQKLEFLMLHHFEIAWMAMMKKDYYKKIADVMGGSFKATIKDHFRHGVMKSAQVAFNRSFFDLDNEVYKLIPYQRHCPSVSAMKFAFPNEVDYSTAHEEQRKRTNESVKAFESKFASMFPNGIDKALQMGILMGIELIAEAGANPALLIGFQALRVGAIGINMAIKARKQSTNATEEADRRELGFAATMYSHFLPRFISSVDGRMRADIWSSPKNIQLNQTIGSNVLESRLVKTRQEARYSNDAAMQDLQRQVEELEDLREDILAFMSKVPSDPGKMHAASAASIGFGSVGGNGLGTGNGSGVGSQGMGGAGYGSNVGTTGYNVGGVNTSSGGDGSRLGADVGLGQVPMPSWVSTSMHSSEEMDIAVTVSPASSSSDDNLSTHLQTGFSQPAVEYRYGG